MKTYNNLKSHFAGMSIEQLEQESKRLFLSMNDLNDRPFALLQAKKSEMIRNGYNKEFLKIRYKQK